MCYYSRLLSSSQTYVGEILVAVNPFKFINGIYAEDKAQLYTRLSDRATAPPHVFASADAAFSAMIQNPPGIKANQVCVISGESGAGKTESAKLFMKQVLRLSTGGALVGLCVSFCLSVSLCLCVSLCLPVRVCGSDPCREGRQSGGEDCAAEPSS